MDGLRESLRAATTEIRRLVNDLRPPMLDAFGLAGAIRQLVPAESDIAFDLRAPEPMPALPAAVEVAAYRIAGEAIHNVIRHSGARRCLLRIALAADELGLEVSGTTAAASPPISRWGWTRPRCASGRRNWAAASCWRTTWTAARGCWRGCRCGLRRLGSSRRTLIRRDSSRWNTSSPTRSLTLMEPLTLGSPTTIRSSARVCARFAGVHARGGPAGRGDQRRGGRADGRSAAAGRCPLDLQMPEGGGLPAIRQIVQTSPAIRN